MITLVGGLYFSTLGYQLPQQSQPTSIYDLNNPDAMSSQVETKTDSVDRQESPAPTPAASTATVTPEPALTDPQTLARSLSAARFGDSHWQALNKLWQRESGWNPAARNRSSGACGIPQALPCHKITDHSPSGQIEWGLGYIAARYGNPTAAWRHWQAHGWY